MRVPCIDVIALVDEGFDALSATNTSVYIATYYSSRILMCCFHASDACFLPVAMSVRDLKEQVVKRLNEKHPDGLDDAGIKIPSESWIAYQFCS